ncbi:hypothetical protein E4T43_07090 [Aureobasidium subglaciale]|nr:hypothetical protein E4T43_07090 [Aureobasidium subglaciale]
MLVPVGEALMKAGDTIGHDLDEILRMQHGIDDIYLESPIHHIYLQLTHPTAPFITNDRRILFTS